MNETHTMIKLQMKEIKNNIANMKCATNRQKNISNDIKIGLNHVLFEKSKRGKYTTGRDHVIARPKKPVSSTSPDETKIKHN